MASLENLTDGELRVKLLELGYPVGPITTTTKKVLLKKLKYLLEQSKTPGSEKKDVKNHSSLSRYSSEEESEDDTKSSTRRRRSMPPPPPPKSPPRTIKRRSLARQDDTNFEDHTVVSEFNYPSASSTLNNSDSNNIFSGFQNHRYSPKDTNQSPSLESKYSSYTSRYSARTKDAIDSGSDTDGLDENNSKRLGLGTKSSVYSLLPGSSVSASSAKSRFLPQTSEGLRFSSKSSGSNSDVSNLVNSPFSSDFVRRLSAASSNKSGKSTG